MKWRGFIEELKGIFGDLKEIDSNTIYFQEDLVRIVKKNREKLNVYFHAEINPSYSAETGIILASMQSDFNFEIENIDVFYYSDNSLYRGNEALKKNENEKAESIKIDFEYENLLENLDESEMFKV